MHAKPVISEPNRDVFLPKVSLDGRNNYKRYVVIERDGSITERVYLNILDKRQREDVIGVHFLQFLVRHFIQEEVGINIQSRDSPWDFRFELSTGAIFNLEIVSIADNELQFKVNAREEAREKTILDEQITLRQLQKIGEWFPDKDVRTIINDHKRNGRGLDDLVRNPHYKDSPRIYVSLGLPPDSSFSDRLDGAVRSKEAKRSTGKENTVLIIDNRTSVYYVDEVTTAIEALSERLRQSPFKEIWFYNGYCSNYDGSNGEYTFISMKVTPETLLILNTTNE